jgi:hypothetical protein
MKKLITDENGIERKATEKEKDIVKNIITERYNKVLEKSFCIFLVFIFLLGFNTFSFINNTFPLWLTFLGYISLIGGIYPTIKLVKTETDLYEEAIEIIEEEY